MHNNPRENPNQKEAAPVEMQPGESLTSYLARLRKAQGGDGKFLKVTNLGPVTQMFTRSSTTPEKPKPDQNTGDSKPVEAPAQSSSSATP